MKRQLLQRMLNSSYSSWGAGLTSNTRLWGTPLFARQQRINRASAQITDQLKRMFSNPV
jgi:hypothetical protein